MDGRGQNVTSIDDLDALDLLDAYEQALAAHFDWFRDLMRVLLCGVPFDDESALDPCCCTFGRWYETAAGSFVALRENTAFSDLGQYHEAMHAAAAMLVRRAENGVPLPVEPFDEFLAARQRFEEQAQSMRKALWGRVCLLDPLTGLRNRQGMMVELCEDQERGIREGTQSVIGMMDIDRFKRINDRYGHATGDGVLRHVAGFIRQHIRPYDRAYRIGGEELLVSLSDIDLMAGWNIFERLRADIAREPLELQKVRVPVTVSIGVVDLDLHDPVSESINRADTALYAAKDGGRDRVMIYGRGTPSH